MNTISQWQIYSPIPFTEYNPDVTKWAGYTNKRSPTELDINRNVGRYEDSYYDAISFYVKDYSTSESDLNDETLKSLSHILQI